MTFWASIPWDFSILIILYYLLTSFWQAEEKKKEKKLLNVSNQKLAVSPVNHREDSAQIR